MRCPMFWLVFSINYLQRRRKKKGGEGQFSLNFDKDMCLAQAKANILQMNG